MKRITRKQKREKQIEAIIVSANRISGIAIRVSNALIIIVSVDLPKYAAVAPNNIPIPTEIIVAQNPIDNDILEP